VCGAAPDPDQFFHDLSEHILSFGIAQTAFNFNRDKADRPPCSVPVSVAPFKL
jgi:hypothetical protein